MKKMFKLVNPGTNEDVFGGEISRDNVYINTYPSVLANEKPIDDLEVGEGCLAKYSLSGTSGTYKIVRTK
jgi:hypothetical protein